MMNTRPLLVVVGLVLVGLLSIAPANAALFEETFDSYTTKENYWPTTSDSWVSETDGAVFSIVDNVAIEGKSVKLEGFEQRLYHEFDRQTSGIVTATFYMRNSNAKYRSVTVALTDDWSKRAAYITMQPDSLQYHDGAWKTIVSCVSNQWIKVMIEVNMDAQTYNIYTDDELRVTNAGFNNSGVSGIRRIYLDNSGAATGWVDEITIVPEPVTIGMLALGGVGMLLRRNRSA